MLHTWVNIEDMGEVPMRLSEEIGSGETDTRSSKYLHGRRSQI